MYVSTTYFCTDVKLVPEDALWTRRIEISVKLAV